MGVVGEGGAIVQLIGFPGVGKYTIAKLMAGQHLDEARRWVVVDNHYFNNTIFGVLDVDGMKPLDPRVWAYIGTVRNAVLETIEYFSPSPWSFVFTNVLFAGEAGDEASPGRLEALANARGAAFVPVLLRCDVDELVRRVVSPERRLRLKWIDAESVRSVATTRRLIDLNHPHGLDIDVTGSSAEATADLILKHVSAL